MKNPVKLDVLKGPWNLPTTYQYLLNVNMFHVAPFACAVALFTYGSQVKIAIFSLNFTENPTLSGFVSRRSNFHLWALRGPRPHRAPIQCRFRSTPANSKPRVWTTRYQRLEISGVPSGNLPERPA